MQGDAGAQTRRLRLRQAVSLMLQWGSRTSLALCMLHFLFAQPQLYTSACRSPLSYSLGALANKPIQAPTTHTSHPTPTAQPVWVCRNACTTDWRLRQGPTRLYCHQRAGASDARVKVPRHLCEVPLLPIAAPHVGKGCEVGAPAVGGHCHKVDLPGLCHGCGVGWSRDGNKRQRHTCQASVTQMPHLVPGRCSNQYSNITSNFKCSCLLQRGRSATAQR
jgi:hypothetical protein